MQKQGLSSSTAVPRAVSLIAIVWTLNTANAATVELPAGSVDGLATAIAAAGPGGIVLVKSGSHTESGTVVVDMPVVLKGEAGTIVACGTAPSPLVFPNAPAQIAPTLLIKGTRDVTVEGLTFQPLPPAPAANCAVFIENSPDVRLLNNTVTAFQFGVLVNGGDRVRVAGNTIACTPLWAVDPQFAFVSAGVNVLNGREASLIGNRVSGAFFGLFGNDADGQMRGNTATGCYIGFQLCKMMAVAVLGGQPVGANSNANGWFVQGNEAEGNHGWGYLVIDGAHHNVLANNQATNNPTDVALTGDGDFYGVGIPLPASHDNFVVQTTHTGLKVMDCGDNNLVTGDVTTVPCPPAAVGQAQLRAAVRLSTGALRFTIRGPAGAIYGIEASPAAGSGWHSLGQVAAPDGTAKFTDADAATKPAQLYRAVTR